jgi:hypothetical protein
MAMDQQGPGQRASQPAPRPPITVGSLLIQIVIAVATLIFLIALLPAIALVVAFWNFS